MSKQYRIDELVHYGIKGQKWGRRRYQNADGSLTPAGKIRYGEDATTESINKQQINDMKLQKHIADKAAKDSEGISRELKESRRKKEREAVDKQVREQAYKMSDKELRDVVNRLNMEERYAQVMRDRASIDTGRTKTEKFLDFSASALSATASALTIAIMVKELKK